MQQGSPKPLPSLVPLTSEELCIILNSQGPEQMAFYSKQNGKGHALWHHRVCLQTNNKNNTSKKKKNQILPTSPASVITLGPGNSFSLLPAQCLADRKQDACSVHEARRNHLSATYEPFPRSSEILSCLSLAFRQAALARNTKKWEMRTWKFPAANGG